MKQTILFFGILLYGITSYAQLTGNTASTEIIDLKISTPQPRLNDPFEVSVDVSSLQAGIFQPLSGKLQVVNNFGGTDYGVLRMNVYATKKGKQEIGPLEFYVGKTKYVTNKISYEVVDALPETDEGLWFRKIMTSDTTFCIIIEQRIPAAMKITATGENATSVTTEAEYEETAAFKRTYSVHGLTNPNSHSRSGYSSVEVKGKDREFKYSFAVYYFEITDRKAKIKITKDKLEHIPAYYTFEDIIIQ